MRQTDFINSQGQTLEFNVAEGVELSVVKAFYSQSVADVLFTQLLNGLNWQEESIFIFGKWVKVPRLMCWYGDCAAHYRYSGVDHTPIQWTDELLAIRHTVEEYCQCSFNSVLANLYRNGQDSMGCHADNEPELGLNPTIASLSLGEERLFKLQHQKTKQTININLQHGDLLLMAGTCQTYWMHSIPKTKTDKSARINLTFRKIWMR